MGPVITINNEDIQAALSKTEGKGVALLDTILSLVPSILERNASLTDELLEANKKIDLSQKDRITLSAELADA